MIFFFLVNIVYNQQLTLQSLQNTNFNSLLQNFSNKFQQNENQQQNNNQENLESKFENINNQNNIQSSLFSQNQYQQVNQQQLPYQNTPDLQQQNQNPFQSLLGQLNFGGNNNLLSLFTNGQNQNNSLLGNNNQGSQSLAQFVINDQQQNPLRNQSDPFQLRQQVPNRPTVQQELAEILFKSLVNFATPNWAEQEQKSRRQQ